MSFPASVRTAPYPSLKHALMASSSVLYSSDQEGDEYMCLGENFHRMEPFRWPFLPFLTVYSTATQLGCGTGRSLRPGFTC